MNNYIRETSGESSMENALSGVTWGKILFALMGSNYDRLLTQYDGVSDTYLSELLGYAREKSTTPNQTINKVPFKLNNPKPNPKLYPDRYAKWLQDFADWKKVYGTKKSDGHIKNQEVLVREITKQLFKKWRNQVSISRVKLSFPFPNDSGKIFHMTPDVQPDFFVMAASSLRGSFAGNSKVLSPQNVESGIKSAKSGSAYIELKEKEKVLSDLVKFFYSTKQFPEINNIRDKGKAIDLESSVADTTPVKRPGETFNPGRPFQARGDAQAPEQDKVELGSNVDRKARRNKEAMEITFMKSAKEYLEKINEATDINNPKEFIYQAVPEYSNQINLPKHQEQVEDTGEKTLKWDLTVYH